MAGPGFYHYGPEEIAEVLDVLNSKELSRYRFDDVDALPSKVYQFERLIEETFKVNHCLGMNSCTSALLAGWAALGIGPGDEVIVPGYTFIASIASIAYSGALPVLAEIDESLTLDPADVIRKITPRTKAILVVHMMGVAGNMDELQRIALENNLFLVEDVAQACGGSYRGKALGSIGDLGTFSLNVFKTITAGDGGFLTTNNPEIFERAFAFHDHGAKPFRQGVIDGGQMLGLNLRMHEVTGALALAQARKLPGIIERLNKNKRLFKQTLGELLPLTFRKLHDPEGDCGTTLTMIFDSREMADNVASAIHSKTLAASGKHYYANMLHLQAKNMPTQKGFPFDAGSIVGTNYETGSLPQTDDLLHRSVTLSVGVVDSYLGTDFGIDILSSEPEIIRKAELFAEKTRSIFK